jgi:large subunit ribosomal protein L29
MKASEIRQKTDEEIEKDLLDLRSQVFKLRLKFSTNQLTETAKIGLLKKDIARLETEKDARRIAAAK